MKDNLEVIECPPQRNLPDHPIEALRRENARVWELVWGICKLASVGAGCRDCDGRAAQNTVLRNKNDGGK